MVIIKHWRNKTCRECFVKGKYRGKLSKLKRILNKKDPVDRRVLELVKKRDLSFCFVGIGSEEK